MINGVALNTTTPWSPIPAAKEVWTVPIGYYSAIFLILSGVHHLFVTLPGVNDLYNRLLARNQQPFRWVEYASGWPRAASGAPACIRAGSALAPAAH